MSGTFKVEDTKQLRDVMRGQCLGQAWWMGLVNDLLADAQRATREVSELAAQREELLDQARRWRCWIGKIREQAAATLEAGSGFCVTCSQTKDGMDALRIVYAQADAALRGEEP
jgi:hypothetical protein